MLEDLYVFTDESSTSNAKYMLLGGLAVKESNQKAILERIAELRKDYGNGELKWSKLANHNLSDYKRFVDVVLDAILVHKTMTYHAAIFDNHSINHRKYSGSNERGFFTLYSQFLVHSVGKRYMLTCNIHVRLDRLTSKYPVHELKFRANDGLARKPYKYDRRPFRSTEYRDSEKEDLIQLVDLITGALAFRKNELHKKPDARQSKVELSDYIIKRSGISPRVTSTPYSEDWFTVWEMIMREPR